MQVVSSHISLFVLVPPSPFFSVCLKVSVLCKGHHTASKIVCYFSRKTRVLHQEVKNTIAGCCDESSNPLSVQSSYSAVRGMVVFFFNARKFLKILRSRNPKCFLRNVKKWEFFCACDLFTIHNINIVIYNIKSSVVSKIKKNFLFPCTISDTSIWLLLFMWLVLLLLLVCRTRLAVKVTFGNSFQWKDKLHCTKQ